MWFRSVSRHGWRDSLSGMQTRNACTQHSLQCAEQSQVTGSWSSIPGPSPERQLGMRAHIEFIQPTDLASLLGHRTGLLIYATNLVYPQRYRPMDSPIASNGRNFETNPLASSHRRTGSSLSETFNPPRPLYSGCDAWRSTGKKPCAVWAYLRIRR